MKTPSKSKADKGWIHDMGSEPLVKIKREQAERIARNKARAQTGIIPRMEAMQQRFNPFPSLLISAENDRRLQLKDRADWVQDGDPPALPGESELEYNERTGRYDQ